MSFPDAIDLRRLRLPQPRLSLRRARSLRIRRPSRFSMLIALLITLMVAASSYLLIRNSSLVAVEEVKIVGLEGYYDKSAREAVTAEALQMTTMNFDEDRVLEAATAFVDVEGVRVATDLPHAVTIEFDIVRPVVVGRINGRTVALSSDGEILSGARGLNLLPTIDVSGVIRGNRVTDGKALKAVTVLGAAPDILLREVVAIRWGRRGLTLELEKGALLYFGNSTAVRTKWRDAAAILANTANAGLSYIDLRAPGRPSVGGLGAAPVTIAPGAAEALPEEPVADPAQQTANLTQPENHLA
ncbi:MAG: cell division protein FtsQ/DivIB, partial [Solirubrobacterales bacterium]